MITDLPRLDAVKILNHVNSNSVPLELMANDGEIYFAKTLFRQHPPFEDLINEILCHYLLRVWDIYVPDAAVISIRREVLTSYSQYDMIDKRYLQSKIEKLHFFAAKKLEAVHEYNRHNLIMKNKRDFNKFSRPLDFIKIAVFDNWIANKDRRVSNPNLLLQEVAGRFRFVPIDHVQAFACQSNYKALNPAVMNIFPAHTLLVSGMLKSICNFADPTEILNLEQSIVAAMDQSLSLLDDIFKQIPAEFGLSKAGKEKVREVLTDKVRNARLSKIYVNYRK